MLQLVVLGSGSRGNCTLVRYRGFSMLIDAGLSARQIVSRVRAAGFGEEELDAVLLTHEHSDHVSGLVNLSKRVELTVYANGGTLAALDGKLDVTAPVMEEFETGARIEVGPFEVRSFSLPHDAADPVGFVIEAGSERIGYATDLGHVTKLVASRLRDCSVIVFEANHDREMLRDGPYPVATKQRVASRLGHLSNDVAARELTEIVSGATREVVLAHISERNNDARLAVATVGCALAAAGRGDVGVTSAPQSEPTPAITIA